MANGRCLALLPGAPYASSCAGCDGIVQGGGGEVGKPIPLVMATGVPSHGARQSRGNVPLALGVAPLAYFCDNGEQDERNNTVDYKCANFGERNRRGTCGHHYEQYSRHKGGPNPLKGKVGRLPT